MHVKDICRTLVAVARVNAPLCKGTFTRASAPGISFDSDANPRVFTRAHCQVRIQVYKLLSDYAIGTSSDGAFHVGR